jgi:O-methyltransferase involved in polyketide biosynthesis
MQTAQPSRTAVKVAIRRAAHQLLDTPRVLDDPLALRIIGTDAAGELNASLGRQHGRVSRAIRAFIAVRSRRAEDELARAIARGVTQYVVLGAGLDTFAYRTSHAAPACRGRRSAW